jgi:predicted RNA-binding protein associated with RNAse of E/G family
MEAPETFILIRRWWLLRFRDIEREETKEDERSWIVPLAALGLLIIVVGIVAETYCEGKVSDVDALLRAHESDKITAAENEAASATRQAGTAAFNAQIAKGSADAANKAK